MNFVMADCEGQREQQREEALAVPEQGHDPVCSSTEELPYPTLAPVVCFGLQQTTRPRNWCLQMTCSPYPLLLLEVRQNTVYTATTTTTMYISECMLSIFKEYDF